jgi:hypothetical protein
MPREVDPPMAEESPRYRHNGNRGYGDENGRSSFSAARGATVNKRQSGRH